jgi:Xaa-Pro aminopeptidase
MHTKIPQNELGSRMSRFRAAMEKYNPGWEMAAIFSKINMFYFTGTMQEGMVLIPRQGEAILWVRRSYERAVNESLFGNIQPMESFRDASAMYKNLPKTIYIETEFVPLAMYQRFQKYFPFAEVKTLDYPVGITRAVKSAYELELMITAGQIHCEVLEEDVPSMLSEGMNEVELAGKLYATMLKRGHHGLVRFGMLDTEVALGHIAFGESSIYPTSFNGPGGNYGMSPAVPLLGNHKRLLKKGDLVFVDIGLGVNGYHTDKTMTYMYGNPLPDEAIVIHHQCVAIQDTMAEKLKPGAIPSQIYEEIMGSLDPAFLENFMGYGNRQVKFLGHGIGLTIDEVPVIAKGFDEPLVENMVLALEPKKGIKDIGMVGIENTYIVTPEGGKCITGNNKGLILC